MPQNNNNTPAMTPIEFCDLVAGMDPAYLCAYLQIHTRTLTRWKKGTALVPHSAEQLLKLKLNGEVASFAGEAWKGFFFGRDGRFYIPYFHRGFEPAQICAMFFEIQELRHYRNRVRHLEGELARLQLEAWALRKVTRILSPQEDRKS